MSMYQGGAGASEAEFQRIAQNISSNIQKIVQNVSSMQRMVRQLGTSQDSEALRDQLRQIQHYTNQLAKDTHRSCKDLDTLSSSSSSSSSESSSSFSQRQCKLQRDRLTNDFTSALTNFQAAQRLAAESEREEVRRVRAEGAGRVFDAPQSSQTAPPLIAPPDNGAAGVGVSQTQVVLDDERRLHELRDRESAVQQLESDIMDVNQIFRDLASMVHEQGEVIDSIEANVETAHGTVQQGVQQLGKAANYQSGARKKKLCLFVVLAVVIIIIIVIVARG